MLAQGSPRTESHPAPRSPVLLGSGAEGPGMVREKGLLPESRSSRECSFFTLPRGPCVPTTAPELGLTTVCSTCYLCYRTLAIGDNVGRLFLVNEVKMGQLVKCYAWHPPLSSSRIHHLLPTIPHPRLSLPSLPGLHAAQFEPHGGGGSLLWPIQIDHLGTIDWNSLGSKTK